MTRKEINIMYPSILILGLVIACSKNKDQGIDKNCYINIDTIDFTFGIDYSNPAKYLEPGDESDLSDIYLSDITSETGTPENNIEYILQVCYWVNQNFTFQNAGGNMIGKYTVDELFANKIFYGCHSAALIISSVLRELGFPAIMIETADINWAYSYRAGLVDHFSGHVMSEIYVQGKWILLDNNGYYIDNYNELDPYLNGSGSSGDSYFAFAKGVDIWDYSGRDESFTHDNLKFFAENIYCFEEMFYLVDYTWKN